MVKDPAATKAYIVLLVENELAQRVSIATHLRNSGFHVIEAVDGQEARSVLDSVDVNVMFANVAKPGQTNGLALLRWLREHHPAIKVIVTSDTETDLAALDGCGIFLSKPYRLVDLDYCLQKVLAAASVLADETGGAKTADPSTKRGPEPGKVQPGNVSPKRPPAPGKADGRDDEVSELSMAELSMAELSRRLGVRAARQQAVDPGAAKAARRAALQAYERARVRRQRLGMAFAVAAVVGSAIAYLVPTVPASPSAAARPEPTSPLERTAATSATAPPDSTSPSSAPSSPSTATSVAYTPAIVPVAAPVTASEPSPVEPAPNVAPLRRDEMREVQARLRSFGFNPGPVDGAPGAMTEGAVIRYQQNRGQPQTGKVDRELLEQLRRDPAPQLVQRAAGPYARPTRSPGPRRSDPFEPIRAAGNRLGQWLDSLAR
jgi:DNA-binding response OmpR family regulator